MKTLLLKIEHWLKSLVQGLLAEERKITSAMLGSVRNDLLKMETRMVKDLTILKHDLLSDLMKPVHLEEMIKAAIEKEAAKLHSGAVAAAHNAVQNMRAGVTRVRCEVCNQVVTDWKLVEGKIECADCAIRKAL